MRGPALQIAAEVRPFVAGMNGSGVLGLGWESGPVGSPRPSWSGREHLWSRGRGPSPADTEPTRVIGVAGG
jgi:hypothetical protein